MCFIIDLLYTYVCLSLKSKLITFLHIPLYNLGNQLMSSSETGFWGSSPCSSINSPHDSECSPNSLIQHQSQPQSPYHHYNSYTTCQAQSTHSTYDPQNAGEYIWDFFGILLFGVYLGWPPARSEIAWWGLGLFH